MDVSVRARSTDLEIDLAVRKQAYLFRSVFVLSAEIEWEEEAHNLATNYIRPVLVAEGLFFESHSLESHGRLIVHFSADFAIVMKSSFGLSNEDYA